MIFSIHQILIQLSYIHSIWISYSSVCCFSSNSPKDVSIWCNVSLGLMDMWRNPTVRFCPQTFKHSSLPCTIITKTSRICM